MDHRDVLKKVLQNNKDGKYKSIKQKSEEEKKTCSESIIKMADFSSMEEHSDRYEDILSKTYVSSNRDIMQAQLPKDYLEIEKQTRFTPKNSMKNSHTTFSNSSNTLLSTIMPPPQSLGKTIINRFPRGHFSDSKEMQYLSCKTCNKQILPDYRVCPYCRTNLAKFCSNCGKEMHSDWQICPYCCSK